MPNRRSPPGRLPGLLNEGPRWDADREELLWVDIVGYDPQGSLLVVVPLPVERPTSCAFGGPDLATLFVTTARHGLDETALARQPDAGRVLRVDGLGVVGVRCAPYRGQTRP